MSRVLNVITVGGDISESIMLEKCQPVSVSGTPLSEKLKWPTQKYWQSMPNIFMARIGKYHALPKLIFDLSMYVK